AVLNIKGTPYRVHHAGELGQQPISGVLDDAPTVLSDLGIDERAQMVREPGVRSLLVLAGQPTVARHVGRQDGSEPSLYALRGQACATVQGGAHDSTGLAEYGTKRHETPRGGPCSLR